MMKSHPKSCQKQSIPSILTAQLISGIRFTESIYTKTYHIGYEFCTHILLTLTSILLTRTKGANNVGALIV